MRILDVEQGSPEWHAARRQHFCASQASAMLGVSKYMTRTELMDLVKFGVVPETTQGQQYVMDRGHKIEALARTLAEKHLGEDLYPVVGTATVEGLPMLASFDGLTMDERIMWECKSWNKDLVVQVMAENLESHYWAQLEHGMLVSQAQVALFTVSDGSGGNTIHMRYQSQPERRAKIIAGWKQFSVDLESYNPEPSSPAPVAAPIQQLPALVVQLVGKVTSSNMAVYRETALAFIENINTDLQSDQDFADAEKMAKFCEFTEKELDVVKKAALEQTADIAALFRVVDELRDGMRAKRLELERLVKIRKDAIRAEIVMTAEAALRAHIYALNARLDARIMPAVPADFAGAIKGKRTIASLRDAINTTLADAKIRANEIADHLEINRKMLAEMTAGHEALFRDADTLVHQQTDALRAIVSNRIREWQEAEQNRIAADRARIQAEEAAKAKAEAAAVALMAAATAQASQLQAEAASVPHPVVGNPVAEVMPVVAANSPKKSAVRLALDAALSQLSDEDVDRVYRFVQSRYPNAVTA